MTKRTDLEARRARVARLVLKKYTTRAIADMTGTSQSSVQQDIKWLRKAWAKDRGGFNEMLEDTMHTLAYLQGEAINEVETSGGTDKLSAIQTALKVLDQSSRLGNLYPKPGIVDGEDTPTGPIEVKLSLVDTGNRKLVDQGLYNDGDIEEGETV